MSQTEEKTAFADIRTQIRETMDEEWRQEGISQEDLDIRRQLSDLFHCELAAGRAQVEIETAWSGNTPAQILSEYSVLATQAAPRS